jgi:4'-phosphopantetheinyl transferase
VPGAVEVHVWWALTDDLTESHLELLDRHERERRARYERQDDRDRFTLGSALVRTLVAGLDGTEPGEVTLDRTCPRCGAQHGPVTTPGRPWRCSVAHSGPFAVAAVVAAGEAGCVGVDLETRSPREWTGLLASVLAPGEVRPGDEAGFLRMWVRKEAVVKATGEGLSRPLSSFTVSDVAGRLRVSGAAPDLRVVDLDTEALRTAGAPTVAAALAVGTEHLQVRWQRAPL